MFPNSTVSVTVYLSLGNGSNYSDVVFLNDWQIYVSINWNFEAVVSFVPFLCAFPPRVVQAHVCVLNMAQSFGLFLAHQGR